VAEGSTRGAGVSASRQGSLPPAWVPHGRPSSTNGSLASAVLHLYSGSGLEMSRPVTGVRNLFATSGE
jgi:hypothetical protein